MSDGLTIQEWENAVVLGCARAALADGPLAFLRACDAAMPRKPVEIVIFDLGDAPGITISDFGALVKVCSRYRGLGMLCYLYRLSETGQRHIQDLGIEGFFPILASADDLLLLLPG